MNCFLCDQPLTQGRAKWLYYGSVKRLGHDRCDRAALMARAARLGVVGDPGEYTDTELADAIAAELLSGEWLARLERLPSDEAKRDAVHRLALALDAESGRMSQ